MSDTALVALVGFFSTSLTLIITSVSGHLQRKHEHIEKELDRTLQLSQKAREDQLLLMRDIWDIRKSYLVAVSRLLTFIDYRSSTTGFREIDGLLNDVMATGLNLRTRVRDESSALVAELNTLLDRYVKSLRAGVLDTADLRTEVYNALECYIANAHVSID